MAFTEEQKVQIRFFLGYPDVFRYHNPRLESAIETIGGRPQTQALVEFILGKLNAILGTDPNATDPGLIDQVTGDNMGISKIKDFETEIEYGNSNASKNGSTASTIYNEIALAGRGWVSRLSNIFGVEIWADVFGTRGYQGDLYKAYNGMSNNWFGL